MTTTVDRPTTAPAVPEGLRVLPSGEFAWTATYETDTGLSDVLNSWTPDPEPCLRIFRCVDGAWQPVGRRFARDLADGWAPATGPLPVNDEAGQPTGVQLDGADAEVVRGFAGRAPRREIPVTVYSEHGDRKHSGRCTSMQECGRCAARISEAEDRANGHFD